MKQLSDSVGRLWRSVTRRSRPQSAEIAPLPPQPSQEEDPWPAIEAALLCRSLGLGSPPPPPVPRPTPPPQPPLVIPAISPTIPDIQGNLPFDVLSRIFTLYNNASRDNYNEYSNEGIPWRLGQICHSWRQVALNTPQLWNCFELEVDEDNADNDLPEKHQALVSRSGTGPLRVSLDFRRYYDPIPGRPFRAIEPLLERSAHWTTVLIQGLDVSDAHRQLRSIRGQLPLLRSLKFYFRGRHGRDNIVLPGEHNLHSFNLFEDCPSLTVALLNDMFNCLDNFAVVLPWNQIKTYGAYNTPGNPLPSELDRQPNLESLNVILNEFPSGIPIRQISHHHLRELYVYSTQDIETGFTHITELTLPSLELLVLTFMTMELRHKVSIISTVITLVQNSKCQLKKLAIQQNCDLYIDRLPTLFALTPALETLDIGHGAWFRDTLALLRFDPNKATLLPNLKRLVVAYTASTTPNDMKLVRELVESRKHAVSESCIGTLFQPLLYVRLHIKRSEARYWCMMDLEGIYVPPEGHTNPSTYSLDLDLDPEWEYQIQKAMSELSYLIDSPTHSSPSENAQIVAKYHEAENVYRRRVLCTTASGLYGRNGENRNLRTFRQLCRRHIPPEYIRQRTWVMTDPCGLFYIHPEHESRTSTQQTDIILGVQFPPATGFEGYGYWFSADIDRQMENFRPFIC